MKVAAGRGSALDTASPARLSAVALHPKRGPGVAKGMTSLAALARSKQLCLSHASGSLPPGMHDTEGSGIIG